MKIVLYGGDAHQLGSGGFCYAETLREMGHTVLTQSEVVYPKQRRNLHWRALHKLRGGPLEMHRRRHASALVNFVRAERPDIVIILKGLRIGGADVDQMRELGAWTVLINHDDFFSQNPENRSSEQFAAVPHYDHVFVTREVNVNEIAPFNPRVSFLPFAYYPRIHRAVPIDPSERAKWMSDVVFVGNWEAERCAMLEYLVEHVPANIAVWGDQWEHMSPRSPLRPSVRRKVIFGDEMAKAIGGSKIALAFLRKKNRDEYTQRTFEIPACGGLLLAERTPSHERLYRHEEEAVLFDPQDAEDLVRQVRALLDDDNRRERIRVAGQTALLKLGATYYDRLQILLSAHKTFRTVAGGLS